MPTGSRVRANNVYGTISDNPLLIGATAFTSLGLNLLPAISGQHAVIVFDPKRVFGAPEIVVVTSHLAMGTTATITRGAYGTTARQHTAGTAWAHIPIGPDDYTPIVTSTTRPIDPYLGELIYETDTSLYKSWNGTSWVSVGTGGSGGASTLAYAETLANGSQITAETLIVSVNVTVPAGRRLRITGQLGFDRSVVDGLTRAILKEDGNIIQIKDADTLTAGNGTAEIAPICVRTPSAGIHTYTFHIQLLTGTGTTRVVAGATFPTFIHVEDVTGSETPFANSNVPVGALDFKIDVTDQVANSGDTLTNVSLNVSVAAGRLLHISLSSQVQMSATGTWVIDVLEDAVNIGRIWTIDTFNVSTNSKDEVQGFILRAPAAGAHTYTFVATRNAGTGTLTIQGASGGKRSLVKDITSTPTAASGAPSSTLGYAEVLANQGSITAEAAIVGLSTIVTVPAGRRLRISSGILSQNTGTNQNILTIKEDGVSIRQAALIAGAATTSETIINVVERTPTAGSHTYAAFMTATAGTATMVAGAANPAFILVEDITGSVWPAGQQVTAGIIASEAWTSFTATPTSTAGAFTTVTGSGAYIKLGRTIHYRFGVSITTVGTATGDILFTPPFQFALAAIGAVIFGTGRESTTGNILTAYQGSATQIAITGSTLASGKIYSVAGTYEATS